MILSITCRDTSPGENSKWDFEKIPQFILAIFNFHCFVIVQGENKASTLEAKS